MTPDFFEDKAMRILNDPKSRLLRIDQHSRHSSTYVLKSSPDFGGGRYRMNHVKVETLSEMEVIGDGHPPCFICLAKGKLRGSLHVRPDV